jgi:hypothetical protein
VRWEALHFFVPLGNEKWMRSVIGVRENEVTELDWWDERPFWLRAVQVFERGDVEVVVVVVGDDNRVDGGDLVVRRP